MTEDYKPMTDSNKKQPTESQSSTLVPFPNPQEVDRELCDLHGIPYPESTPSDSSASRSQPQTQEKTEERSKESSNVTDETVPR